MSEPYPLPRHAAYIWQAGETLSLAFPPGPNETKGHTIRVRPDSFGLAYVLKLLQERARTESHALRIGRPEEPTQHLTDRVLNDWRRKGKIESLSQSGPKRDAGADLTLEDLGL